MTERQLYILDQYHTGQLSQEEQIEFDQFAKDIEFRELAELGHAYNNVVRKERLSSFQNKVMSWENDQANSDKKNYTKIVLWFGLLALIGLVAWFFLKPQNQSDILYAEYFRPFDNLERPLERSEDREDVITKSFVAYESGEYRTANNLFDQVPTDSVTDGVIFYHAITKLALGEIEAAASDFNSIATTSSYRIPAVWYKFLIAVKIDDRNSIAAYGDILTKQKTHKVIAKSTQDILNEMK